MNIVDTEYHRLTTENLRSCPEQRNSSHQRSGRSRPSNLSSSYHLFKDKKGECWFLVPREAGFIAGAPRKAARLCPKQTVLASLLSKSQSKRAQCLQDSGSKAQSWCSHIQEKIGRRPYFKCHLNCMVTIILVNGKYYTRFISNVLWWRVSFGNASTDHYIWEELPLRNASMIIPPYWKT